MVGFIADEVKFFKKNKSSKENSEINQVNVTDNAPQLKDFLPENKTFWVKVPHLLHLNCLMFIVTLSATNTGYDGSLLNAFQSMPDWKHAMGDPAGAVLGALNNGTTFGAIIAFFCASSISDRLGRRNAIAIANIIMIIGTIIQSCAGTWLHTDTQKIHNDKRTFAMSLVARMIIGFGNSVGAVSAPSLISELSYPTHRQTVTAFFNSNWYLGAIIAGWVSFGTRNMARNWCWRVPTIIQGFFPIVQSFLIYLVPESPRYQVSKGRIEEARKTLLKFHAGGDESIGGALVDFEMSEIESAIEQEKLADKSSYLDFFRTPGNRKRLFLICYVGIIMQLSGNGLVSYYLNKVLNSIGVTSTTQQLIFNGGLQIYNWGISIIINLLVFQTFKRRMVFNTSLAMMLVFYILWTILSAINQERNFEDKSLAKGVMAMIFLYYLAYNIGLNGLPYLYMTEIGNYKLRAKALNINIFVQQLASVYNGFVNSIAMDAIEWKYYIVYCCILAVELIVGYLTIVETSGRTLEEIAEVFGESIGDHGFNLAQQKNSVSHLEHAEGEDSGSGTSEAEKSNNLLV